MTRALEEIFSDVIKGSAFVLEADVRDTWELARIEGYSFREFREEILSWMQKHKKTGFLRAVRELRHIAQAPLLISDEA